MAAAIGTAVASIHRDENQSTLCEAQQGGATNLPTFSRAEVAKHRRMEDGVWVTYGDGVYDITDFVENHPGGSSRIMMAAGGKLEPFWKLYAVHKKAEVQDILKEFQIGRLSENERASTCAGEEDSDDPFAKDPWRHPSFVVNSQRPFNAEPPPELLLDAGFITPNDLYYVRNHLPVPDIKAEEYRLHVGVEGNTGGEGKTLSLSLEDLKTKFPRVSEV
ncbi:unnamed protein product, partial [Choristocarpus tenellus]